jgi:hypothetical protein
MEKKGFRVDDAAVYMQHRICRDLLLSRHGRTGQKFQMISMQIVQKCRSNAIAAQFIGMPSIRPAIGDDYICIPQFTQISAGA